jgi:hypothetical protein
MDEVFLMIKARINHPITSRLGSGAAKPARHRFTIQALCEELSETVNHIARAPVAIYYARLQHLIRNVRWCDAPENACI